MNCPQLSTYQVTVYHHLLPAYCTIFLKYTRQFLLCYFLTRHELIFCSYFFSCNYSLYTCLITYYKLLYLCCLLVCIIILIVYLSSLLWSTHINYLLLFTRNEPVSYIVYISQYAFHFILQVLSLLFLLISLYTYA